VKFLVHMSHASPALTYSIQFDSGGNRDYDGRSMKKMVLVGQKYMHKQGVTKFKTGDKVEAEFEGKPCLGSVHQVSNSGGQGNHAPRISILEQTMMTLPGGLGGQWTPSDLINNMFSFTMTGLVSLTTNGTPHDDHSNSAAAQVTGCLLSNGAFVFLLLQIWA
jgi:hypothetical protein